ncbi:hypothetical protein MASR1M60_14050 [Rhodocyclaceae bacterium]
MATLPIPLTPQGYPDFFRMAMAPITTDGDMLAAEIGGLITANRRETLLIDLALGEGVSPEQLAARWQQEEISAVLADDDSCRKIEELANTPAVQRMVADMVARRNVTVALGVLRRKLEDPECSASVARDIAELSIKQAAQLGTVPAYERVVKHDMHGVSVTTPFTAQKIDKGGNSIKIAKSVIRAARCLDRGEVDSVLQVLGTVGDRVALRGW